MSGHTTKAAPPSPGAAPHAPTAPAKRNNLHLTGAISVTPSPQALTPPPHPTPVFRVLKQAWREHIASGGGLAITVNTPAGQAHTAPLTVTGTVQAAVHVPLPVILEVRLVQAAVTKAIQITAANVTTGAWTTTFPANLAAAGATTAAVTSTIVPAPISSGSFTLT